MKMSAEILTSKELSGYTCMGMSDAAYAGMSDCACKEMDSLYSEVSRHNLHLHAMKHMLSVSDAYCSRVTINKLLKTI